MTITIRIFLFHAVKAFLLWGTYFCVTYLGLMLLRNSPLANSTNILASETIWIPIYYCFLYAALIGIAFYLIRRLHAARAYGFVKPARINMALFALLTVVFLLPLVFFQQLPDTNILLYGIVSQTLIAVTEEFYFRGFLLGELAKINRLAGALISSLLFIHWDFDGTWTETAISALNSFCVGLTLACVVILTGSLIPAIFLHCLSQYVALLVPENDSIFYVKWLFLLVCIVYLVIEVRKNGRIVSLQEKGVGI